MSNSKPRQYDYHDEEDGTDDGLIKMAALGRRFQLGTLYDYRTDNIIPGEFQAFLESGIFTGLLPHFI